MADDRINVGYDVLAHIPAGVVLSRDVLASLIAFWASAGYRVLTQAEIEAITGPARTIGKIRKYQEWDDA